MHLGRRQSMSHRAKYPLGERCKALFRTEPDSPAPSVAVPVDSHPRMQHRIVSYFRLIILFVTVPAICACTTHYHVRVTSKEATAFPTTIVSPAAETMKFKALHREGNQHPATNTVRCDGDGIRQLTITDRFIYGLHSLTTLGIHNQLDVDNVHCRRNE